MTLPETRARHRDDRELLTGILSEGSWGQEQEGESLRELQGELYLPLL